MKIKTKWCLFIFVLFIGMSTVFAADASFSELQTDVNAAQSSGNSITLNKNYTYNSQPSDPVNGISISKKNFVFDGNDYTLNGDNKARIFYITANNVTIKNVNLVNGNSTNDGGAIYATGNQLSISNTNFVNNHGKIGGAVYASKDNLFITHSNFLRNVADKGGAIYTTGNYAKIYDTTFELNTGFVAGGAIYTRNSISIHDSEFISNRVIMGSGGAIDAGHNLGVYGTNFINNSAVLNGNGGAIWAWDNLILEKSNFINNSAYFNAGAVNAQENTKISESTFIGNIAIGGDGGALVTFNKATIDQSTFKDNVVLYNDPNILIKGFEKLDAVLKEFGMETQQFNNQFQIDMDEILYNITHNEAKKFEQYKPGVSPMGFKDDSGGGAIWAMSDLTLTNSVFKSNKVEAENNTGGAIRAYDNLKVDNCIFEDNYAEDGGALFGRDNMQVFNSIFKDNKARDRGGAIYTSNDRNQLLVENSIFTGNIATDLGGALYTKTSYKVLSSYFEKNKANEGSTVYLFQRGLNNIFNYNSVLDSNPIYNKINSNVDGNYNWWGTNSPNFSTLVVGNNFKASNYYTINVNIDSVNHASTNDDVKYNVNIFLNGTSSNTNSEKLPNFNVTVKRILTGNTIFINTINAKDKNTKNNIIQSPGSNSDDPFVTTFFVIGLFDSLNREIDRDTYNLNGGNLIKTTTKITVANIQYGESAIINIEIMGTNTNSLNGFVTLSVDGKNQQVAITNGKGVLTLNNLNMGNHNIKATFDQTETYSSSTDSTSFTVDAPTIGGTDTSGTTSSGVTVKTNQLNMYYKDGSKFIVTLLDAQGKPLVGKDVVLTINGIDTTRTTNETGQAFATINLAPGSYELVAKFDGVTLKTSADVKTTIIGKDIIKYFKNDTQYYFKVYDSKGNLMPNKGVEMNINGILYNRVSDANGEVKLSINLNPSVYIITVYHPDNGQTYSNKITVLTVLTTKDISMTIDNRQKFLSTLVDDVGKPLQGKSISININGVFYDRVSDSQGIVSMNINLDPGSYIATLYYNGYSTSALIIVI